MRNYIIFIFCFFCVNTVWADNIDVLKNMSNEMVVKKNISLMSKYYDRDFVLYTNGETMGYEQFYTGHKKVYETPIQYAVEYDKDTLVENDNKVATRMMITTKTPGKDPVTLELILIATFKDNKITRLWELTYPNWTKLKSFDSFSK